LGRANGRDVAAGARSAHDDIEIVSHEDDLHGKRRQRRRIDGRSASGRARVDSVYLVLGERFRGRSDPKAR
jgi:hypothetical protein